MSLASYGSRLTLPRCLHCPTLLIVEITVPAHPQRALERGFFAGSPPLPSSPRHCPTPQDESPTAPKAGPASQEESFASAIGEPPSHCFPIDRQLGPSSAAFPEWHRAPAIAVDSAAPLLSF